MTQILDVFSSSRNLDAFRVSQMHWQIRVSSTRTFGMHNQICLSQSCVDFFQHPRARTQILLVEPVKRRVEGVEVGVEVFGVGGQVEESGEDFALGGSAGD